MSKICKKCGAVNYESATICARCGSLFRDGAYSGTQPSTINTPSVQTNETQNDKKEAKKNTIIIASIGVVIAAAVATILIIIISAGNTKETTLLTQQTSVQKQTASQEPTINPYLVTGWNDLTPEELEAFVPVKSISVSEKNIKLKEGQSKTVSAAVQPENATSKLLSWVSDNTDIVRISGEGDGYCEITAVKAGKTNVWVIATGAEDTNPVYTYITVIVEEKEPPAVIPSSEQDLGEYIVTAKTYLCSRKGPGTKYKEVERIKTNEVVEARAYTYDDDNEIWYFVYHNNKAGWVLGKYLKEKPAEDTP